MLVKPPGILRASRTGDNDGRELLVAEELILPLAKFADIIVNEYRGSADGYLAVNSSYRPKGADASGDKGGAIDLTDANGHWTGRAIDYSSASAFTFWPKGDEWVKDVLRWALWDAGFRFPWYLRRNLLGIKWLEHWHFAYEVTRWKQAHAYRDRPIPWRGRAVPENWRERL